MRFSAPESSLSRSDELAGDAAAAAGEEEEEVDGEGREERGARRRCKGGAAGAAAASASDDGEDEVEGEEEGDAAPSGPAPPEVARAMHRLRRAPTHLPNHPPTQPPPTPHFPTPLTICCLSLAAPLSSFARRAEHLAPLDAAYAALLEARLERRRRREWAAAQRAAHEMQCGSS